MDPAIAALAGIQSYGVDDPVNGYRPPQPDPTHVNPTAWQVLQQIGMPIAEAAKSFSNALTTPWQHYSTPDQRMPNAVGSALKQVAGEKLNDAVNAVTYPATHAYPPSFADSSDPRTQGAIANAATLAQRLISPAGAFRPKPGVVGSGMGGAGSGGPPEVVGPLMQKAPWSAPSVEPQGILAYHGSPHDFEKFDISKIGTGEGAQVYGHGLYYAGNEGVARSYRDQLTKTSHPDPATNIAVKSLAAGRTPDEAASTLSLLFPERSMADIRSTIQSAQDYKPPTGHMYEVNLQHNPEHFLDWDKPIGEQHQKVQELAKKVGMTDPFDLQYAKGAALYRKAGDYFGPTSGTHRFDVAAASGIRQSGIPGIRYLDQGSRAGGEGSRNYVAFDDKNIDILRKYGIPGLISAGAAGGAAVNNLRDYMGGKEDENNRMLQFLQQGGT